MTKTRCSSGMHSTSDQLMYGTMRMVSKDECPITYGSSPVVDPAVISIADELNKINVLDKICLAAEPSATEACDSGSPLLSQIGDKNWVQIGVLFGSSGCDEKHHFSTRRRLILHTDRLRLDFARDK
ncbi:hypothetical protein niasHS_003104 [Heterodera schachtii]|uniref:Uncharacterized protein n=1 Tax=Heterodera schachtii TaxID=97005 RepID=A0ABD2KA69_HETSC